MGGTRKEFFEKEAGKAGGIVADDAVLFEEIVQNDAVSELRQVRDIDDHGLSALGTITLGDFRRDRLAIGDDPVDEAARSVVLNGAEMIGQRVTGSFARLSHEIGDVDARCFGFGDGTGDFRDEQIRKNAGVERTWAQKNQVGILNGLDCFRQGADIARKQRELPDWLSASGNARFSVNFAAAFERGDQRHVGDRGRKNSAANGQDFAADPNRFREVAGNVGKSGKEEVAEIVADEASAGAKAILKEVAEASSATISATSSLPLLPT